jgi:putative aldouronate transport system substrate-binding protein
VSFLRSNRRWMAAALILMLLLPTVSVLSQDDVPTIIMYTNNGFLQFDAGGSNPDVLAVVQDYITEQTGVRPEAIIPPSGPAGNEALNLLLGSNDQLDIFTGSMSTYAEIALPLNDLLEEYGQDILKVPDEQWAYCTDPDGNILCIPRQAPFSPHITWVRGDWLDELGLEMPTTLEELEAILAAFKEAYPDSFMTTAYADVAPASVGAFTEYGYSNWLDPEDNRIKPWILQPGVRDWVAKSAEWYEKGYFYPDTFTNYDPPEVFRTNNVGVHLGWYSRITLIVPLLQETFPEMRYERTEGLSGPKGYFATIRVPGDLGIIISRKSQNPEAAIRLLNWLYSDVENYLTSLYGLPGEGWSWVDEENKIATLNEEYGYKGEYAIALTTYTQDLFTMQDAARAYHEAYRRRLYDDFSDAKIPFDFGVVYDGARIADETPGLGDINRLIDEQLVLFFTGARSLDTWDAFIEDLYRAGMDDWINALTTQYNEFNQE